MTPVELNIYARAQAERRREEQKLAQANLYSLAALIRPMIWAKHPPKYEQVYPENRPKQDNMTDDQMYATVRALNALFGGEEVS